MTTDEARASNKKIAHQSTPGHSFPLGRFHLEGRMTYQQMPNYGGKPLCVWRDTVGDQRRDNHASRRMLLGVPTIPADNSIYAGADGICDINRAGQICRDIVLLVASAHRKN